MGQCTGLGVDNTNANIVNGNYHKIRVLSKSGEVTIAGCPCHILRNAAGKVTDTFVAVSGLDLENHCVEFEKSSKQKSAFKEHDISDVEYHEVIKCTIYILTSCLKTT